ncbi:uncharacterized protein LOC126794872 [Argentina anserina]|uniref:uncharacterized protein LOC126794872 n=1 Tax=Argentina anserina TaxID=57926 RepID=UPI0021768D2A|nr:uncharacterized protein LOC126794872 [Potentilla anserina]
MQTSMLISHSPSFNAYSSSNRLAQIAARVVSEFRQELDEAGLEDLDDVYDDNNNNHGQFSPPRIEQEARHDDAMEADKGDHNDEEEEEEEFEFAFVCREAPTSPIAAEEVFYNGQIRSVYPVFDQSLLLQVDDVEAVDKDSEKSPAAVTKPRRLPLGRLMIEEERENAASCSSSEADDLENLPPGTYCVWAPPKSGSSGKGGGGSGGGGGCDKSGSTGSSKRWKFRDLLSRSSSDGAKDTYVFFAPTAKIAEKESGNVIVARKVRSGKGVADGDKRRSYLPNKQDLLGFFSNVNGLSRNLHPF